MTPNDFHALTAVLVFACLTTMVLGSLYLWTRRPRHSAAQDDAVVQRLARVEVALDDVTAELARMTEAQRFLTQALADRALPVQAHHG